MAKPRLINFTPHEPPATPELECLPVDDNQVMADRFKRRTGMQWQMFFFDLHRLSHLLHGLGASADLPALRICLSELADIARSYEPTAEISIHELAAKMKKVQADYDRKRASGEPSPSFPRLAPDGEI
jgi:hypothetical protein